MEAKKVTQLCLGGGKMVDLTLLEGAKLIGRATVLDIKLFDTHHRYGNSEKILSSIKDISSIQISAKVSAYQEKHYAELIATTMGLLGASISIFWVSDLDNKELYKAGENIYKNIYNDFVGITSEDPGLTLRFAEEHPECNHFMIPLFIGRDDMVEVCKRLRLLGKQVWTIKPFDDGRLFEDYSVEDCLRFVKKANPTVMIFGTKQIRHLEEVVDIWSKI